MQHITLIGHLGQDPEAKYTPDGTKVIQLYLGVTIYKKKEGFTTWYRISIFGENFSGMIPHLKKGTQLIVIGDLEPPRPYLGKDGQARVELGVRPTSLKFVPFKRKQEEENKQEEIAEEVPF